MQPRFIEVPKPEQTSFLFRDMVVPYFYNPYHFHPEYELTYVIEGWGTRYIGDHIDHFSEGDLVLVGANLPHMWKNDKVFFDLETRLGSRAIVIQFNEDFAGKELWQLPEMKKIQELFTAARQGLTIKGQTKQAMIGQMLRMLRRNNAERIADLILIICTLAESGQYKTLSSLQFASSYTEKDGDRLNKVYMHVVNHFTGKLSLEEIAEVANMSPTAFCRYFKSRTHKTFSRFLVETRINYACKLLVNDDISVTQAAFEAGFNTSSYFNRQFCKIKGMSPLLYRKKFRKE